MMQVSLIWILLEASVYCVSDTYKFLCLGSVGEGGCLAVCKSLKAKNNPEAASIVCNELCNAAGVENFISVTKK